MFDPDAAAARSLARVKDDHPDPPLRQLRAQAAGAAASGALLGEDLAAAQRYGTAPRMRAAGGTFGRNEASEITRLRARLR
jgi:hypothetical protein